MDAVTDGIAAAPGRDRDEGFTLIELLIVIVILGILSVVVVISVRGLTDRGQTSACEADLQALRTAAESVFAQTGRYPATEAELVPAFLSEQSTLHDYTGTGTSYTITAVAGRGCPQPTQPT